MASIFRIDLKGDELHLKLGGGIPVGSIIIIEAPDGMGKSVLAQRFTYGVVVNNQSATYISTELSMSGFMNQMSSLRYDIKSKIISHDLKFVSLFPSTGHVKYEKNLIEKVFEGQKLFDSNLIVFDSLNKFLIKDEINLEESFKLLGFFRKVAGMGKSIVFCVNRDKLSKVFYEILQGMSDVYLRMEERDLYGNKMKYLKVERFMGAVNEVEAELPFKVKAGIGIVAELAS